MPRSRYIRLPRRKPAISPRNRAAAPKAPAASNPAAPSTPTAQTPDSQSSYSLTQPQIAALLANDPSYLSATQGNAYNLGTGLTDLKSGTINSLTDLGVDPGQMKWTDVTDPTTGQAVDTDPYTPGIQTGQKLSGTGPDGKPLGVNWNTVDAANPFSRAGLLVKSYRGAVSGTNNSMAAAGQRNSGADLRAQQRNTFNFGQGQDQVNRAVSGAITGANTGVGRLIGSFLTGNTQAYGDAFNRLPAPSSVFDASASGGMNISNQGTTRIGSDKKGQSTLAAWQKSQGGTTRVKLANGYTIEYVNGKPVRFIPPGGK